MFSQAGGIGLLTASLRFDWKIITMSEGFGGGFGILDDSLDMLADIRLEGPSESESASEKQDSVNNKQSPTNYEIMEYQTPSCNFYGPENPPYCDRCVTYDHQIYFSLTCKSCEKELEQATVPQILAIMRQWSSETQSKMLFYIEKVSYQFWMQYPYVKLVSLGWWAWLLILLQVLDMGCQVFDYDTVSGCTLLHFAARSGSANVGETDTTARCVRLLLDRGANIHMKDLWTGMMPLHYAAFFNAAEVVRMIADHHSPLSMYRNTRCL